MSPEPHIKAPLTECVSQHDWIIHLLHANPGGPTDERVVQLSQLSIDLHLRNRDVAFHHLNLCESHYLASKWGDSISNSRELLECVLTLVAAEPSRAILKVELAEKTLGRPVDIREYLESNKLLDSKVTPDRRRAADEALPRNLSNRDCRFRLQSLSFLLSPLDRERLYKRQQSRLHDSPQALSGIPAIGGARMISSA